MTYDKRMVSHQVESNDQDQPMQVNVGFLPGGHIGSVRVLGRTWVWLGNITDQSKTWLAGLPAWAFQQSGNFVANSFDLLELVVNVLVVTELQSQRVIGFGRGCHTAKDNLLVLLF